MLEGDLISVYRVKDRKEAYELWHHCGKPDAGVTGHGSPRSTGAARRHEDLLELRAAVEENAGKPGVPWEQVKAELDLD